MKWNISKIRNCIYICVWLLPPYVFTFYFSLFVPSQYWWWKNYIRQISNCIIYRWSLTAYIYTFDSFCFFAHQIYKSIIRTVKKMWFIQDESDFLDSINTKLYDNLKVLVLEMVTTGVLNELLETVHIYNMFWVPESWYFGLGSDVRFKVTI